MLQSVRFRSCFGALSFAATMLACTIASAIDLNDAVSTMAGSLDRLIADDPRLAAEAIAQREHFLAFQPLATGGKSRDKQIQNGKRRFEDSIARFVQSAPGQIEGDLKRVEREIERMASDRPNPRNFQSIAVSTLERTAGKAIVLRATGDLSPELETRYEAAIEAASEIVSSNREAFRDLTRLPRDRYRSDDADAVRAAATDVHADAHPGEQVLGVLLPEQNWRTLYGALWDDETRAWQAFDVGLLPAIVLIENDAESVTLSRVVLRRPRAGGPITVWEYASESPLPRPTVRRDQIKE